MATDLLDLHLDLFGGTGSYLVATLEELNKIKALI